MKKINFVIGKRQIMISTLLLILAVAAYLNWQFAASDQSMSVMDVVSGAKKTTTTYNLNDSEDERESTYGETELVSSQAQGPTDYFSQAKLQKAASHAETSDELDKIINAYDIPDSKKNEASEQKLKITENEKQENSIETQIIAKGFNDCVVYVENDQVSAMVKTDEMTDAQAAQIKDIIIRTTNVKPYNIVVTPIK